MTAPGSDPGSGSGAGSDPGPDERLLPVSFAIVGAQKAATSTLHTMLVRHRHIARGDTKELHVFDDERLDWSRSPRERLLVRATRPSQRIAGDATPSYLWWPGALDRMRAFDPAMRLIASFRDPIERAFSQWSMERVRQDFWPSFSEAIVEFGDLSLMHAVPSGWMSRDMRRRSLVVRGLYGAQLERGLSIFPVGQWRLLEFTRIVGEPGAVLDELADFLAIGPWRTHPELRTNPTPRDQTGPPPTAADVERLVEVYAPDLELFARLSAFDVSGWPTVRVARGELAPAELAERLARKVGLASED